MVPASAAPGHVFVVLGKIESIVHDVALVPTDVRFDVSSSWSALLGASWPPTPPSNWGSGVQFAPSSDNQAIWFIDVADEDGFSTTPVRIADRAARAVRAIAEDRPTAQRLRVALPVLGIAGGGLDSAKGAVLKTLLSGLRDAVRTLDVDVLLTTPDPAVHGALQSLRRTRPDWELSEELGAAARDVGRMAADGHLALFLGAGVSMAAGLPSWSDLLKGLVADERHPDGLGDLPPLDQAQILQDRLGDGFGARVVDRIRSAARPTLAHALLAGMAVKRVVTTNYDNLYEQAVNASRDEEMTVLPWSTPKPGSPWILKMHGDVDRPDKVVLSRRQFVRYDASARPAGSLLQALLLTQHLLIVGASLDDDNVSRLVHEVNDFRSENGLTGPLGTFIDLERKPARQELWGTRLRWLSIDGDSFSDRVRNMEIFLDCAGAFASTERSWMLDERFAGLLPERTRELADGARALYQLARDDEHAGPLADVLRDLGAR